MLEKPKAPTRIEIDGKTEIVTNIEALHIILKVVGNDLGMDSDFANDVIFLYSNREDYYDSFMLSEASKLYSSTYSSAATRAVNQ